MNTALYFLTMEQLTRYATGSGSKRISIPAMMRRSRAMGILLLCSITAMAQQGGTSPLRSKIDSLNRVAPDHPVEVIKACDSLMAIARGKALTTDFAILLQVKGIALTSLGDNGQALEYHMRSYAIFDSIDNNDGRLFGLGNIAAVHLNLGNYPQARQYLLKALALVDKNNEPKLSNIYVNLGAAYQQLPIKAIYYYRKALPYLMKLPDYNGLAINHYNIAEAYLELDDYASAESHMLKAMGFQKRSGSKSTLAMISLALGRLYTHKGEYGTAVGYLEAGGRAAIELKSPYDKQTYYEYMAQWNHARGRYKEQSQWLEELLLLQDSISSQERVETISAMEAKFQSSLKNKEIELLRAQGELDAVAITESRLGWIVFVIISLLCGLAIAALYRNYKLKQKANLLLGRQKDELQERNLRLEHENILVQFETLKNQVSPHFLFNSLNAMASLIKSDPVKALEFTGLFAKIFRNTLELKDRHLITVGEELQHVNAYLYLQKIRFGESLITEVCLPSEVLTGYLPPFSLQMVVENAIKHNAVSREEPLKITISYTSGCLTITNNLQLRRNVEDSTGTGIRNIISRYRWLNAAQPVFARHNNLYIVQLPIISEE